MNNVDEWYAKVRSLLTVLLFCSKYGVFSALSALIIMSHFSFATQNILKDAKYQCFNFNHQFNITTDLHFVVKNGLLFMTLDDFVVRKDSQPFKLFLGPKKDYSILFSYYATDVHSSDRLNSSEKYSNPMLRQTIQIRHSYPENTVHSIGHWFMETVNGNIVDGNESYYDCTNQP